MIRALAIALCLLAATADARSVAVRRAFQYDHPCPSTGRTKGACPGWQADHIIALCAGGSDTPSNLQWISIEAHKAKTREDLRYCRALRKLSQ